MIEKLVLERVHQALAEMRSHLERVERLELWVAQAAQAHGAKEAHGIMEACSGHAHSLRSLMTAMEPRIVASFEEASNAGG